MKESCPKVRRHHRFHREAAEIEQRLICINSSPIRSQDHDALSYGIGDLAKLHFILSQSILGALSIFNIDIRSIPNGDISLRVAQRFSAEQEPAVLSVKSFPEGIRGNRQE